MVGRTTVVVEHRLSSIRNVYSIAVMGNLFPKCMSTDPIAPDLSYMGFGDTKTPSDLKHLFNNFKQESEPPPPVVAVLTCEDLEQTILSEYGEKSSTLQPPPVPTWTISSEENTDVRTVDTHAIHHLLSLLQKGPAIDDGLNPNIGLLENRWTSEKPKDGKQEGGSDQNLSLEALFGIVFMKELQSAQASLSSQRGSAGSARIDISSSIDGIGPVMSHMTNYESNPLSLKQKQPAKLDDPESWSKFDGQRAYIDPLEFQRGGEIQLPEEESLMIVGEPDVNANTRNPNIRKMLPFDVGFYISEKLANLNSGFRGDRFDHGPYDKKEPERLFNNNLHTQASSPQMHNRQPMFHPTFNMGDLSPYLDDDVLAELRSIPFKGGGDDTDMVGEDLIRDVLVLMFGTKAYFDLMARYVCMISGIG